MNKMEQTEKKVDSGYYQTRLSVHPARNVIWKEIAAYLQKFIPSDGTLLELGAGYCTFINNIKAGEKHALDVGSIVKQYADKKTFVHLNSCTEIGEIFPAEKFDTVFESFLLEHLTREEMEATVSGVLRILKPGGRFIVMQPNFRYAYREYFDDYTHKQIFTHIALKDYFKARGFKNILVKGKFIPFSFHSRLPKSALLTRLYLMSPVKPLAKNMLIITEKPIE